MPQSILLGNGTMLVGIDGRARIKDLYFDYVGLEDHLTPDAVCKIGVFVDGRLIWFEDSSWHFSIEYQQQTLISNITAKNDQLNIEVVFRDLVYNEDNIFIRNITVKNLEKREREIKIYFNHQFRMYGVEKKDTVYFDPKEEAVIHYKGRRVALIGGIKNGESFDDFSVGLSNIEGKAGTWADAEDGKLSRNPIEHGTVDSTVSFEQKVDANSEFDAVLWVCMGKHLTEVKELHKSLKIRKPSTLTESTQDYWRAWVNKGEYDFAPLGLEIEKLYKNSLLVIRTHVDNTGGIIASCDSEMLQYGRDNYTYVWPRDASYIAMAMDKAGYFEVSRKFYEFCNDIINEEGYFFHKYRSDKALGSSWHGWMDREGNLRLPIQEDETALVISALWNHYECTHDIEFIEKIYNSLIKKAGNFLIGYRYPNKLPKPTYDLWEQRWGIHTFTASTVFDALNKIAKFADLLGKESDRVIYQEAADDMQEAMIKHLYSDELKFFYKYVDFEDQQTLHDETIDASSFFGVFKYDVLSIDDEKMQSSYKTFKEKLCCDTNIKGVKRYEGDVYYKVADDAESNPWIITTLWHAQYLIKSAKEKKDLEKAKEILDWVVAHANQAGLLSEQLNPYTGVGLSATPLIWSHAEFVTTVVEYLDKNQSFEK